MENKNTIEVIEYIQDALRSNTDKSIIIDGVVTRCGGDLTSEKDRDSARKRINTVFNKMQAAGENVAKPVASRGKKVAPATPAPVSTTSPAAPAAPANPANASYPMSYGSNGEMVYSRCEPILGAKGLVTNDFILECLGLKEKGKASAYDVANITYNTWDGMAPGGTTIPCGQVKIAVRRKADEDGLTLADIDAAIEACNILPRVPKKTTYKKIVTIRDRKTKKRIPEASVIVYNEDGSIYNTYKADERGDVVVEYDSLLNGLYVKTVSVPKGYNKPGKIDLGDVGYVVQINLADIHVGLLAWAKETGNSYDLKICTNILLGCISEICERLKSMNITVKKIVLATLGDLLHIDTEHQTTTQGTFQQVEGRFPKIFDTALELMENVVDMLLSVAPVEYMYVSGNHDRITGYAVARAIERSYRKHNPLSNKKEKEKVEYVAPISFNITANPIKYFTVGESAIILHHGDMNAKNLQNLPMNVVENKTGIRKYYVHVGHLHSSSMALAANGAVTIEHFDSICLSSAWEHQQGYPESPVVSVYALLWDGTAAPPQRVVGSYDPN